MLTVELDVLIFGGGVAGLWLLDELRRTGYSALLAEAHALGSFQTIASQGIIHGGLKYMFDGNLTPSAAVISEMPALWRSCIAGDGEPNLTGTTVLSDCCYIWGTGSFKSRIFLTGSAMALRTRPMPVEPPDYPDSIRNVPGKVLRVGEQVIDPTSLVQVLARRNAGHILHTDPQQPPQFHRLGDRITDATLAPHPLTQIPQLQVRPRTLVLTAGRANATLRTHAGLSAGSMQLRPLHMAMVRGRLPRLFGHCIGYPRPRITVTTNLDVQGRTIWQIGGQIAEDGVNMDEPTFRAHARKELLACIPNLDLREAEFSSYRVDRAEAATATGQKPDDVHVIQDGNLLTSFPTKLALAPRLARRILQYLPQPQSTTPHPGFPDVSLPPVALPPWETCPWFTVR